MGHWSKKCDAILLLGGNGLERNEGVVRVGFEQDGCRAIINRQEFEAGELRAYCCLTS